MLPKTPLARSSFGLLCAAIVAMLCAACGSAGTAPTSPAERLDGLVDTSAAVAAEASVTSVPGRGLRISAALSLEVLPFAKYTPSIDDYLATRQPQWGAALLLPGEGVAYETNGRQQFPLASLTKVLILGTLLDQVAAAERELTFEEDTLLWNMITVSDNEAAIELWDWIGGSDGVSAFLRAHEVAGIVPAPEGLSWGDTTGSALGIGQLLAKLWAGELLSENHRDYAFELMTSVSEEQRWGAPLAFSGESPIALKNGWYPAVTGWRVASAAMELDPESPRILVILTRNQPEMEYAVETMEGFARLVAAAGKDPGNVPATVAEHPRETLQAVFQPSADGLPVSPGACVPSTIVRRAGSWQCEAEGAAHEFCFSAPAPAAVVVCGATPGVAGTFAIQVVTPAVADDRPPRNSPWLLELESGVRCTTVRTEPITEDGDRITYECSDGSVLLGPIQRSLSFYALLFDPETSSLETVRVARAWF